MTSERSHASASTAEEESGPLTILLSRRAAEDFHGGIAAALDGRGHRFIHLEDGPDANGTYGAQIAFLTREVTGRSGKTDLAPTLTRFYEIMRASPGLRWMQTHSAGADRPIYGELRARGVEVATASGANAAPVAQMAFAGLLALGRRFPELMEAQRRRSWEPLLGERAPLDLKGQTAVVVGLGPIGTEVSRLLKAIGMHVVGVRRRPEPAACVDETIGFADLQGVLPRADWVVLACPLTAETRGLMNAASMASLPRGARIVNVARGEVIVEADLVDAVRAGQVGGAFLDVLVTEPLGANSPLWDLPNVIITPHTASHTTGHFAAVGEIFLDNLSRWRSGRTLRNTIP